MSSFTFASETGKDIKTDNNPCFTSYGYSFTNKQDYFSEIDPKPVLTNRPHLDVY